MKKNYIRIVVITLINIFFSYLIFGPFGWDRYIQSDNLYLWGTFGIIGSLVPTGLTLLFFKLIDKKEIRSMGFRFSGTDAMFSLSMFMLMSSLSLGLIWFMSKVGGYSVHWNLAVLFDASFYLKLLFVLLGWFFAAFYEEILYRGYFISNLRSLNKRKMYVIISIFFMVSHVFKGLDPIYALILMIVSLVFVYVYLKSGSLMPITMAHMAFNFMTPILSEQATSQS